MAKQRQITFIIGANIKNFQKGLDSAQRKMQRFGRKMKRTGRSLTQSITLPLVAAGGAAVKMAADFESSLAEAQAQANLTARQVSFIGDSAKTTAKRTGESLDDIVEAYKFTISAGFNLAKSQETVEAAAEASAAGFGTQRDLVRLTTTALQAYSDQLDSSRQFMDLLIGSAQVMELEVSKLGPAVQRNVGIAKELGIGLDQLLAGIGSVSEIMGDAQRGGRMFQTMLSKLLQPSAEARANISDLYGSLENFHRTIRDDGLLQTMVSLRQRLEEAGGGMEDVFTGQEGLEAALNFTNRAGERTNEILSNMGDTAGSTRSAFDDVSKTIEKRFKKALRNLQVAAIGLGDLLLPIVNDVINAVSDLITRFNDLAVETKKNILIVAGVLGAGGPLLIALGVATTAMAGLVGVVFSTGTAITVGLGAAVVAGQYFADNWEKIAKGFEISMTTMEMALKGFLLTTLTGTKNLFNFLTSFAPPEYMSAIFGIDLSEMALDFTGVNNLIDSFREDLDEKAIDLTNTIAEYRDMEWGSIGDSAKNAFRNVKEVVITQLKGLLKSEEIQTLLGKLDEMFAGIGGGGMGPPVDVGEGGKPTEKRNPFPQAKAEEFNKTLKKIKGNTNATAAALGLLSASGKALVDVSFKQLDNLVDKWKKFQITVQDVSETLRTEAIRQIQSAVISLGNVIGKTLAGAENQFKTTFEKIIIVILGFAKTLIRLAAGIGSLMLFIPGLQGMGAGILAASLALQAAVAGIEAGINKRAGNRRRRHNETVNDALIRSDGSIVEFHPDDNILAMKDFSGLATSGGAPSQIIVPVSIDGREVALATAEYNDKVRR